MGRAALSCDSTNDRPLLVRRQQQRRWKRASASAEAAALAPLMTLTLTLLLFFAAAADALICDPASPLPPLLLGGVVAAGFCARDFRPADQYKSWRGLAEVATSAAATSFLAVDQASNVIVLLSDTDGDGEADVEATIAEASGINHGLAVDPDGRYVYASSDTTVWRFKLDPADAAADVTSTKEVVIHSINANGRGGAPRGHWTRTLVFDSEGRLYVSVGSLDNVDPDSYRSRIRRFDLSSPGAVPEGGVDFASGYVFADGLRNEVGLDFDKHGVLWGVENGADKLVRDDLGGDIHNENPAEELNRFDVEGQHYGYPYCFTEYEIPPEDGGGGRATVWAWPTFMKDGVHTDEWCRANTVPPVLAMQAHSAPLGMAFYDYGRVERSRELGANCPGALPSEYDGDLFIGFHGSWNRDVPTGYKVVRVPMSSDGTAADLEAVTSEDPKDVLWHHAGGRAKWPSGFRPVDVTFDRCGRLFVSSDGTRNREDGTYGGSGVVMLAYSRSGTFAEDGETPAEENLDEETLDEETLDTPYVSEDPTLLPPSCTGTFSVASVVAAITLIGVVFAGRWC